MAADRPEPSRGRRGRTIFALATAVLALAIGLLMRPLTPEGLDPDPHPATSYEEAMRLAGAFSADDGPDVSAVCRTALLTHGQRTGRVVVLFHGLTNCPAQFDSLGGLLFGGGANVFIPRLPRHGRADRMTDALAGSDARELRAFTDHVIDVAAGLGDTVVVAGLSLGGTMAAWAGQNRAEVARAVLIAPLLAPPKLADPPGRLVTRLVAALPNRFLWWDTKRHEDLAGPPQVYPRYATRAVAASLILGAAVIEQARRTPPGCRSAALVTVENDKAVSNRAAQALARSWREVGGRPVDAHEFPAKLGLNHDMIDPLQVGANPRASYPVILRSIAP